MTAPAIAPAIHTRDGILDEIVDQFQSRAAEQESLLMRAVEVTAKAKRDAIVDTRAWRAISLGHTHHDAETAVQDTDKVILVAEGQGGLTVRINDLAHDQMAERTGIPKDYYRRMLKTQPQLLAANINTWFQKEADTRLFRMLAVRDEQDAAALGMVGASLTLRGILGKSYRPIDDAEILAAVLPIAREHGARLKTFSHDERRFHAQFVTQEREVADIIRAIAEKNGVDPDELARKHGHVHEAIRTGFYLRNSEVGFAALDVATFVDVLKCLNGMVSPSNLNVRHLGKRQKANDGDVAWVSGATQALDNAALMSRASDAVLAALDDVKLEGFVRSLGAAKSTTVDLGAQPVFEWCAAAGDRIGLTDSQVQSFQTEVLKSSVEEGAQTHFSLVQGLTAVARQVEDMDRRVELEKHGWSWLHSSAADLVALGQAGGAKAKR